MQAGSGKGVLAPRASSSSWRADAATSTDSSLPPAWHSSVSAEMLLNPSDDEQLPETAVNEQQGSAHPPPRPLPRAGSGTARTSAYTLAVDLPRLFGHRTLLSPDARRMYIIGGSHDAGSLKSHFLIVDMETMQIQDRSAAAAREGLPPLHGHSAVWLRNRICVYGGRGRGGLSSKLYSYNPEDDTWTELPQSSPPRERAHHSAVVHRGHMFVFGGNDGHGETSGHVYAYDPVSCMWRKVKTKGKSPVKRSHHTAALLHGRFMIIFGGISRHLYLSDVALLDLACSEWINVEVKNAGDAPCPRFGHAGAIVHPRMLGLDIAAVQAAAGVSLNSPGPAPPAPSSRISIPPSLSATSRTGSDTDFSNSVPSIEDAHADPRNVGSTTHVALGSEVLCIHGGCAGHMSFIDDAHAFIPLELVERTTPSSRLSFRSSASSIRLLVGMWRFVNVMPRIPVRFHHTAVAGPSCNDLIITGGADARGKAYNDAWIIEGSNQQDEAHELVRHRCAWRENVDVLGRARLVPSRDVETASECSTHRSHASSASSVATFSTVGSSTPAQPVSVAEAAAMHESAREIETLQRQYERAINRLRLDYEDRINELEDEMETMAQRASQRITALKSARQRLRRRMVTEERMSSTESPSESSSSRPRRSSMSDDLMVRLQECSFAQMSRNELQDAEQVLEDALRRARHTMAAMGPPRVLPKATSGALSGSRAPERLMAPPRSGRRARARRPRLPPTSDDESDSWSN